MKRYERNQIYISDKDQLKIKKFRVLIAGAGLGSNIAETLLRIGFETMTIVDGDLVEKSNLNRQNYTEEDIGHQKLDALKKRLLNINPKAQISIINTFIDHDNVRDILSGHDVAINALDFKSDIPFVFDRLCAEQNIYVLHPYNVGFAGIVMVISPNGNKLDSLIDKEEEENYYGFERRVVKYVTDYFNYWVRPKIWIEDVLHKYEEDTSRPHPQLSIASSLVAGMCTSIIIRIVRGEFVKVFPKFYFYSDNDDLN